MQNSKNERSIVHALRGVLNNKKANTSSDSQCIFAAFAASHPTIPTTSQATIIALSRYTFLMDIKDELSVDVHVQKRFEKDMLHLPKILNCSPAGSTIDGWVDCLATDQAILVSHQVKNAKHCFLQCDHAPDGSLVKVLTFFDVEDKTKTVDGSVKQFFLGVEVTGKKSSEIAEGIDHSFNRVLGLQQFSVAGITNDSGGGTPESLYNALLQINHAHPNGNGIHVNIMICKVYYDCQ